MSQFYACENNSILRMKQKCALQKWKLKQQNTENYFSVKMVKEKKNPVPFGSLLNFLKYFTLDLFITTMYTTKIKKK